MLRDWPFHSPLLILSAVSILLAGCGRQTEHSPSNQRTHTSSSDDDLREYSYVQMHMAMPVRLTVYSHNEQLAKDACRAAFQRIADLTKVFSDYEPSSEIRRLAEAADGSPQFVSDELFAVLSFCQKVHNQSNGTFDPTSSPIIQLWRQARKDGKAPSTDAIQQAKQLVGFQKVSLSDRNNKKTVAIPAGFQFDFGAVAKGYIVDQAFLTISKHGITSACIEAGGDFLLSRPPPGRAGWQIDVPFKGQTMLANCAISVSGDTSQFVIIDGRRYSHVVDPRTGQALTNRTLTVVTATSAMNSDALATCGCLLNEPEFQKLIGNYSAAKGVQYRLKGDQDLGNEPIARPVP